MTNVRHLVDIGANLTHDSFAEDLDEILHRALDKQVVQFVVTGASKQGSQDAVSLAQRFPEMLFATVGIHPHHAEETRTDTLLELRELAKSEAVKAIGETGLDFFRDFSPRNVQEKSFEQHLELAIDLDLPLFLHERDAYPRFMEIVREYRDDITKLVVHCFTGDEKALFSYLDMDCHIGITGWICDERRGSHLIPLIKNIPADRLMMETDSPYLLPRNIMPKPKSRRNEPAHLTYVCEALAEATGKTFETVAEETSSTAREFFNLSLPSRAETEPEDK